MNARIANTSHVALIPLCFVNGVMVSFAPAAAAAAEEEAR